MSVLDIPIVSRVRRNHGLEHATINLLNQRYPFLPLSGYSIPGGFFIVGDVSTAAVKEAAARALERLNRGEGFLAIHPNCGTNFVVSGFVIGLLVWFGMVGAKSGRDKVKRLPILLALSVLGLIASQPLGPLVQQRVTTSGDPQGLSIEKVVPIRFGRFCVHRVVTKSESQQQEETDEE